MALAPRGRSTTTELPKNTERTKVWTEPSSRRVPVVYYISRNGHLEHPHFMEVPVSSREGLHLRDVIDRLNVLRGKGMASMYSWSSKRSYKNGFVWHDLSSDDLIHPVHGHEYVLKGSELLLLASSSPSSQDTAGSDKAPELTPRSAEHDSAFPARKKTSWKSFDLNDYRVYKNDLTAEATVKATATQTDERQQRLMARNDERGENPEEENPTTELGREEISPPPSSSSPDTLENLIRADGRLIPIRPEASGNQCHPSGRMRASAVLMHLISCGSISMKEHDDLHHHHLSLVAEQYRRRRVAELEGVAETPGFAALRLEDRDCFSGSLIETKKKLADGPGLKRSSSFDAKRGSRLELAEEIDGVRARCIPRKPKATPRREVASTSHGSCKRINDEPPQTTQN